MVTWKSEELPPSMRRFFSLAGIKEGGDLSPHPSEADPSEIRLPWESSGSDTEVSDAESLGNSDPEASDPESLENPDP